MSSFDIVYHGNATVVRVDPFDWERLNEQRKTTLKFLKTMQEITNDGDFKEIRFEWRGIGCIRFPFSRNMHLHIWHKDLMLPGIDDEGGNIHEHPYQLVSDVLCGSLKHTWYMTYDEAFGEQYNQWTRERAKASQPFAVYDFDKSLAPVGLQHATGWPCVLNAPCSYTFAQDKFHSSEVISEVAVTRCVKFDFRPGSSRALVREGKKPVISTPFEPLPEATFKRVLDCAIAALEKEA